MGHYIYMTPAYYNKVFGTMPEYNSVLFETDDSYSQTQVERRWREDHETR